jgi:hypothetical protein
MRLFALDQNFPQIVDGLKD